MNSRTLQLAALVLFAAASVLGQQPEGLTSLPVSATPPEPRLIDACGRLGHCDRTAQLDNFAIKLQNQLDAKDHVVSDNLPQRLSFASHQLRSSRYYLVESRGLDPSARDEDEAVQEEFHGIAVERGTSHAPASESPR